MKQPFEKLLDWSWRFFRDGDDDMQSRITLLGLAAVLLASPAWSAQGREIFVVNNSIVTSNFLGRVDLSTGALTVIGPLSCNCGYGLAFGPDGRLYATGQGHLITLDPTTAAIESVVGPYGISGAFLNALAFHPTTGELYGIDAAHGTLVKASTLTGALATIGSLGTPCCGLSGLAWNLDGSTLYGIDLVDGSFYSIDPATGSATRIGGWTPLGPTDLATDPATGELYAPEWHNYEAVVLTRVRPTNGVRVGVVDVPGTDELEGIAFPPDSMGNRYCSSTSNSTGGAARILPWGTTSASAANLRISAAPVPNRSGLFLHGPSAAQQPFGNGTLCISGRLIHGSAVVATGEHATYVYDASDARHDLSAFVGTTRHFQYWFRDPAAGGAGFDSSDAFSILIRP